MATIKGLTVAIGADTKQFNKELRAADRSIRNTSREVGALTESLELEFDAGRFDEAMRLAQDVITQTEDKAKALRGQLEYMEKHGGADTQGYQRLQTELIKAESQAVLLKKKLDEIRDLKLDRLVGQFKSVGEGITKAGQAMMPLSVAATGVLASFTAIAKSTVDAAGTLDDMAQEIDLNVEALQRWRYIAAQSGLDNQTLQNALIRTQIAVTDLASGIEGPGSKALQTLGLSMSQAAQGMDANIDTIIQSLAAIEDPIQKASLANEIFGNRLGARIIPLLNNGAEGMAAITAEFEAFGYMTEDQVTTLAVLGDTMERITSTFTALKNEIGVALIPLIETFGEIVETRIIPAVRSLVDWFAGLSERTKEVITIVLLAVAALAPVLIMVGKLTAGVGGLIKIVSGLSQALTFLAAHPIIAVITLIIGLLMMLYTTNEQFRDSINALVSQLGTALMPILNTLMDAFGAIFEALMPIINILGNILGPIIEAITPIIIFLANLLVEYLVPRIEKVAEVFTAVFGFIQKVIESFVKIVEKIVNWVIDLINFLIRQLNKVGGLFGKTVEEIKRVSLTGSVTHEVKTDPYKPVEGLTPQQAISSTYPTGLPTTVVNNDHSNRDITINVTVQNYAEEVDVDKLARDVNLKLAEMM